MWVEMYFFSFKNDPFSGSDVSFQRGIKTSSSLLQVWTCEFCGCEQSVAPGDRRARAGHRAAARSDDLYLLTENDDEYQNVEDAMVVFCVDISGSMSVTTEVGENACV